MKKTFLYTGIYIVLAFVVIVCLFPLLWIMMSSFKTNGQILSSPFSLPSAFSFAPYIRVLSTNNFALYGLNSLLISTIATFGSLIIYAMGAYVIAKYSFPGKNILYILFTITMLVPGHTKTQPIFSIVMNLNLYDTKQGLILVYLSGGMAMCMFVLRSAFAAIPKEMSEAATIDGAGFFRTFWQMHLPLAKSGLATAGILMFLGNWNEYYFAALLTSSAKNRTLPYALAFFNEAFAYDYTRMFAALTLIILPGLIIYVFSQEQVQMSIVSSGVKG